MATCNMDRKFGKFGLAVHDTDRPGFTFLVPAHPINADESHTETHKWTDMLIKTLHSPTTTRGGVTTNLWAQYSSVCVMWHPQL